MDFKEWQPTTLSFDGWAELFDDIWINERVEMCVWCLDVGKSCTEDGVDGGICFVFDVWMVEVLHMAGIGDGGNRGLLLFKCGINGGR